MEELTQQAGYVTLRQFENKNNPRAHYLTTGPEIFQAFGEQTPDAFVAGVGTGGTITGVGEYLKEKNKFVEIVAVEPKDSPVLSGGTPHPLQGMGAGIVPKILNTSIYDEIIQVENDEAIRIVQEIGRKEGFILGYSSGAAIYAAIEVAKRLGPGKKVLALAPDNGERYLSTPLFEV